MADATTTARGVWSGSKPAGDRPWLPPTSKVVDSPGHQIAVSPAGTHVAVDRGESVALLSIDTATVATAPSNLRLSQMEWTDDSDRLVYFHEAALRSVGKDGRDLILHGSPLSGPAFVFVLLSETDEVVWIEDGSIFRSDFSRPVTDVIAADVNAYNGIWAGPMPGTVAFGSTSNGRFRLEVIPTTGGGATGLMELPVTGPELHVDFHGWGPDAGLLSINDAGESSTWLVPRDGSGATRIADHFPTEVNPRVTRAFFSDVRNGAGVKSAFMADLTDGGTKTWFGAEESGPPSWAVNDSLTRVAETTGIGQPITVYKSTGAVLATLPLAPGHHWALFLDFTADSSTVISFQETSDGMFSDLFVHRIADGRTRRISSPSASHIDAWRWISVGNHILFVESLGGAEWTGAVWRTDQNGRNRMRLTRRFANRSVLRLAEVIPDQTALFWLSDEGGLSLFATDLSEVPAHACFGLPATQIGTPGADQLDGTAGIDVIVGRGGNDVIAGAKGSDRLCGGAGADEITGGLDTDRTAGGTGDDELRGGYGADFIRDLFGANVAFGGPGTDTCRVTGTTTGCE